MEKLNTAGLRLKLEKYHFFQESVTYLGHVLDKAGIRPHPDKIKAITAICHAHRTLIFSRYGELL